MGRSGKGGRKSEKNNPPPTEIFVFQTHTATVLSHLLPCRQNTNFISCSLISLDLVRKIREKTSVTCGYGLVVLDDCDLQDTMVKDFISRLVTELEEPVDSKSSGTIVIITTSTGAKTINRLAARHLQTGGSLAGLDPAVMAGYLEEEPGLSSLLPSNNQRTVTTHLVPFLPLSRATVRSCLTRLARHQGISLSTSQVEAVLDMQQVMVAGDLEIVSTGCKQVVSKMDLVKGAGGGGVPDKEL